VRNIDIAQMRKEKELKDKPRLSNEIAQISNKVKRAAASCIRVNAYHDGGASETSSLYSLKMLMGSTKLLKRLEQGAGDHLSQDNNNYNNSNKYLRMIWKWNSVSKMMMLKEFSILELMKSVCL